MKPGKTIETTNGEEDIESVPLYRKKKDSYSIISIYHLRSCCMVLVHWTQGVCFNG